jgi:hypothetical protein
MIMTWILFQLITTSGRGSGMGTTVFLGGILLGQRRPFVTLDDW